MPIDNNNRSPYGGGMYNRQGNVNQSTQDQSTVDIINKYKQRNSPQGGGYMPVEEQPNNNNNVANGRGSGAMYTPRNNAYTPRNNAYQPQNNGYSRGGGGNSSGGYSGGAVRNSAKSPAFFVVVVCVLALVLTVSSFVMAYFLAKPKAFAIGENALVAPTIGISGDTLKWDAVAGADSYSLFVDHTENKDIKTTSIKIGDYVTSTNIVTLRVKAIAKAGGKNTDSGYSNHVFYGNGDTNTPPPPPPDQNTTLATPTGLAFNASTNALSWSIVQYASSYFVTVKNKTGGADTIFTPTSNSQYVSLSAEGVILLRLLQKAAKVLLLIAMNLAVVILLWVLLARLR